MAIAGLIGNSILGRLLATAGLLPGLGLVWTVFYLVDPLQLGREPVIGGLLTALLSWLAFALLTIRFASAHLASPSVYAELLERTSALAARVETVCVGPEGASLACAIARGHLKALDAQLGATTGHPTAGAEWVTGEGYVGAWQRIHRAEEALLDVSQEASVIAEAIYDRARLVGSSIENQELLLRTAASAIVTLQPKDAAFLDLTPAPVPVASAEEARAMLRMVRRAINEFRDERSAGLVRLRRRMTQSLLLTGATSYLVLALAIIVEAPTGAIVIGTALYTIAAIVGLLQRVHGELGLKSEVEDYGLSTARLLHAPIVSGLAGLGGVVLLAILTGPPLGVGLLDHPSREGLLKVFSIGDYPVSVVIAAVFGLTPGLLLDRLTKIGEGLKTDIQKSTAAGQPAAPTT